MATPGESEGVPLGDLLQAKSTDDPEPINIIEDLDIKPKRKPKPKPAMAFPLPQTSGQWLMIGVVAVCAFVIAGIFFWIFPTRTVEVYIVPTAIPTPQPMPPPPDPLYQVDQKVQVFNLTPDVAGYQDWWVSRPQWLPTERVWIYEVRTYDGITLMRAENQLAPYISPMPTPLG